jgi:hypothetical protein
MALSFLPLELPLGLVGVCPLREPAKARPTASLEPLPVLK